MMSPLETLDKLGLVLPSAPPAGGNYVPWVRTGDLLFLSGVISKSDHGVISGRLGQGMDIEAGYAAARSCALAQLAQIQLALGDLAKVKQIVTVNGYVRCTPEFPDAPKVVNGASDLFVALFGERGKHARAAIGVASLPANAAVEIQMTVRIKAP